MKTPRLDDTAIEFKRRMGSDFIYTFDSSGQKIAGRIVGRNSEKIQNRRAREDRRGD